MNEMLSSTGIFSPYSYYKNKLLFASQGPYTVRDTSISMALQLITDPVFLVVMNGEITVFDGHHRVGISIFNQTSIPYKLLEPKEANIVHRYPFSGFYKELKNHMGRMEEMYC